MLTSSSRNRVHALAEAAAFLVAALALSYAEAILPPFLLIPVPGVKIGLANIAVMLAACRIGMGGASAVSLGRVVLSAILFGSVSSLAFSLSGAVLSLAVLALLGRYVGEKFSFIGLSVLCAAAHNLGQLLCAALWMHEMAVLSYLPVLLVFAAVFGAVCGLAVNLLASCLPEKGKGWL